MQPEGPAGWEAMVQLAPPPLPRFCLGPPPTPPLLTLTPVSLVSGE